QAGVSERSLKNWLTRPAFQDAYRAARQEVLSRTVAQLLAACGAAVDTLQRNLTCGQFASENRAAVAILEHAAKGVESLDLADRVAEVEGHSAAGRRPPRSTPPESRNLP